MRREVALAGFALLGILAVAGWTRKPANPQAAAYPALHYTQPAPAYGNAPVPYGAAAPYGAAPMMYVPVQPVAAQPMAVQPAPVQVAAQPVQTVYRQPAPVQRTVVRQPETVRVVQQQPVRTVAVKQPRSTGQSVAIVAGSSGVGAAVGALAGGKKGAAIGALAGGTGGFVYDRMTRNK